jgi:hypothetical protein
VSYSCAVDGCQRDTDYPRGLCKMHILQAERKRKAAPVVERDPEIQAVHDRHPNIKQKPLPLEGEIVLTDEAQP